MSLTEHWSDTQEYRGRGYGDGGMPRDGRTAVVPRPGVTADVRRGRPYEVDDDEKEEKRSDGDEEDEVEDKGGDDEDDEDDNDEGDYDDDE
jgi:hypothetical protein